MGRSFWFETMASITYQNAYLITTPGIDSIISSADLGGPFVITDSIASDPPLLTINETVTITGPGTPESGSGTFLNLYTFVGTTRYPLIEINGLRYLFTDQTYANGDIPDFRGGAVPICFGPDVVLDTAKGPSRVDQLRIGDQVLTPDGPQAVKFIGRSTRFLPELRATGRMPVVIKSGALGKLGPSGDLICTPSHAFLIEGALVEAQALIDGDTIKQLDSLDSFDYTYYSIELENHGLVWANGVLSETYFANVRDGAFTRVAWDNYADYVALYGEGGSMRELELPRIPFARQLPAAVRELIHAQQKQPALIG